MTVWYPYGPRIIIKLDTKDPTPQVTAGGIVIPNTADTPSENTGVVVAVGDLEKHHLVQGDTVLFQRGAGHTLNGEYKLLTEYEILAYKRSEHRANTSQPEAEA